MNKFNVPTATSTTGSIAGYYSATVNISLLPTMDIAG